jgi:hypothetical protein
MLNLSLGTGSPTSPVSVGQTGALAASSSTLQGTNTIGVSSNNTASGSTGNPFPTVTPSLTANCMIRVLAMIPAPRSSNSFASNDNRQPIADRRRSIG